jgi:outer membrane receptor protein involved in Fe transport
MPGVLAAQAQDDEPAMESVLVTATHQPGDATRLPLNWALVSRDDLLMVEHIHPSESFQRVAGGWISRGNGQESLTALRSPVLTGAGSCGAFFMGQDGISLRAPGFCNVNQLFDANTEQAERIEVIKGPATALYGSGAMHGVVNVITPSPVEGTFHRVSVEGGPHDYYRGKYLFNTLGDRHGVVVAINGVTDDGYKDDSGYDQYKVTLHHAYEGERFSARTIVSGTDLDQETAGFIQEGREAYKVGRWRKYNPNPEAYREAQSWRAQSTFSFPLGDGELLTVTPYFRDNDMEFLQHFLPWQPVEENGQTSYGLMGKLYHDTTWLRFTSGVDLEYTDGWLTEIQDEPFPSANFPAGVHYDYQVDAILAALYTQFEWDMAPALSLNAGIRYEYTEYDYDNKTGDGPACSPAASNCRFFRPADRDDDFDNLSLNVGLLYDYATEHAAYVRLARGFRAPQATELYRLQAGQRTADLDSEELSSFEAGFRGSGDGWQYELGLYYTEKDEVIFQDANRQNVSGASTLHYGLDLSLRWQLTESVDLALDGTVARHEYDDRINLIGSSGDIEGNDIDTAPHHFGSARLGWNFLPDYRGELEWVHMSEYYLEPDNNHEYDGHDLLNLRVTGQLTPRLSLGLRVTNLLDEDYAERADFGFGQYRYFVGETRSLYVQLEYLFSE